MSSSAMLIFDSVGWLISFEIAITEARAVSITGDTESFSVVMVQLNVNDLAPAIEFVSFTSEAITLGVKNSLSSLTNAEEKFESTAYGFSLPSTDLPEVVLIAKDV